MQDKQDKQKVTLYISPGLHRQLKVRAAVDSEPMSSIVEKAILFYLSHPDIVEQTDISYGRTHLVHTCPECSSSVVLQGSKLVTLGSESDLIAEPVTGLSSMSSEDLKISSQGEENLVPC
ncbi:MAG: hypothetical protein SFW36_22595 [Leptolyngbyaceae cyanobacterium bins.59]|nr:hypothetical protein [Leptolyngbyaceae cyanobacterium bins.59]